MKIPTIDLAAVILAAGKSTRMKSAYPKAIHTLCGKPMARHIIDACRTSGAKEIAVVVGHEADAVKTALGNDVCYALQSEQLGTGHAAAVGLEVLSDAAKTVMVLAGDAPLITPETLRSLVDTHKSENNVATMLTAILPDAANYGRIVRGSDDCVARIVEAKDATPDELSIREINPSLYVFDACALEEKLKLLKPDNAQGEYYLTDVIGLMVGDGSRIGAVAVQRPEEVIGINNRVELAEASRLMRDRILNSLMLSGVTFTDPASAYIDVDVEIGQDTTILPCTVIKRGCKVGSGCKIGPFVRISNSRLGNEVSVQATVIEGQSIADKTVLNGCVNGS